MRGWLRAHDRKTYILVIEHWRPPVAGLEELGWQREGVTLKGV